jgi:hypothetical protein
VGVVQGVMRCLSLSEPIQGHQHYTSPGQAIGAPRVRARCVRGEQSWKLEEGERERWGMKSVGRTYDEARKDLERQKRTAWMV